LPGSSGCFDILSALEAGNAHFHPHRDQLLIRLRNKRKRELSFNQLTTVLRIMLEQHREVLMIDA
jgi:hypothetical protein